MHTMRDSQGKSPKDFFPFLFEDDEDSEQAEPLSEEDYAYEQKLMADFNFGHQEAPDES